MKEKNLNLKEKNLNPVALRIQYQNLFAKGPEAVQNFIEEGGLSTTPSQSAEDYGFLTQLTAIFFAVAKESLTAEEYTKLEEGTKLIGDDDSQTSPETNYTSDN